jgi:hypothetical protein
MKLPANRPVWRLTRIDTFSGHLASHMPDARTMAESMSGYCTLTDDDCMDKLPANATIHWVVHMRKTATNRSTSVAALIAALLLVTLLVYAQWRSQPPAESSPLPTAENRIAASSDPSSSADHGAIQQGDKTLANATAPEPIFADPLPSTDTNVAEVFDIFYSRAQRGDARAACWLGQSLKRCASARKQMQSANELIEISAQMKEPADSLVNNIAGIEQFGRSLDKGCDGLSDAQLDMAFTLEMQAAQAIPELRLRAVLAPALDPSQFLRDLDRWADYKRVAVPWLEEAAKRGDPTALITLARVFGDHRRLVRLNPPFRIADDAKFVLYADLMSRYGIRFEAAQADLDAARERLSADAQAKVLRQVDALYLPQQEKLSEEQAKQKLTESFATRADPSQCEVQ